MITVLITTHNYGRFLEQAVDSVLAQDYPLDQVQILVVDDGSTDDTSERVKKYGNKIEYFYKPNGGQASALNFGFLHARGELIALMDADDLFMPSKLARIAEAFQQDPSLGMVYHRPQEWQVETDTRRDWDYPLISGDAHKEPDQFLLYVPHPTSCISFRRDSLKPLLPIPEHIRMIADCYLVALIPFLAPIRAIPESLTVYRIHGKNSEPYFANLYQADDKRMPVEIRERKAGQWQIVVDAMAKWLSDNGFSRKDRAVRNFLDRWTLSQDKERFIVRPPSRLQYFRHLLLYNSCYGPHISRRLRIINYFNAYGALITGYKHFYWLEVSRKKAVKLIRKVFRREATAT